jgi:aspartyl-tRNA(Asn)/glutamyl-tRNA(Gln) amidotransferase subunit C
MPEITLDEVEKTSLLAKLEFTGEEKDSFLEQFSRIVDFVEKISELDTEKVPPMTHAVEKSNTVRDDAVKDSMPVGDISKIAPRFESGSIVVPKIIEY